MTEVISEAQIKTEKVQTAKGIINFIGSSSCLGDLNIVIHYLKNKQFPVFETFQNSAVSFEILKFFDERIQFTRDLEPVALEFHRIGLSNDFLEFEPCPDLASSEAHSPQ